MKKHNLKNILLSSLLTAAAIIPVAAQAEHHGETAAVQTHAFTYAMNDERIVWADCPAFFAKGCKLGILQGDPSKPNSDVVFKTPGNYDLPEHWHTSAERMVLISGEMDLTYKGQETIQMTPGMYIYGPPKLPHTGRCVSAEPCELFIAFEGPIDAHEGHGH
jgi:mannose-6-phosphate isomerase-like protein (cupin superfamily)